MSDLHHFEKLTGVHPRLIAVVTRCCDAFDVLGFTLIVTDGVRTEAEQVALYAKGRTAPGKIVTHADGIVKRSNHQLHSDGLGHAVDCAFLVNGKASWDEALPWELYGLMAKTIAVGVKWGGDFKTITDKPHLELS